MGEAGTAFSHACFGFGYFQAALLVFHRSFLFILPLHGVAPPYPRWVR